MNHRLPHTPPIILRTYNSNLREGLIDCIQLPSGYGDKEEELEAAKKYYFNS